MIARNSGAGIRIGTSGLQGGLASIDDVIPEKERAEFMAGYKAAAGFAIEKLNTAPPTIPPGTKARSAALV